MKILRSKTMKKVSFYFPALVLLALLLSASASASDLRFVVIGDYGTHTSQGVDEVAELVNGWDQQQQLDFIITTGDNIYVHPPETYDSIISPFYDDFIPERFFPSTGNHDFDYDRSLRGYDAQIQPYLDYFNQGRTNPIGRHYDFQHGGVHFFSLDSHPDGPGRPQQWQWVQQRMRQSTACFTILYFHHPPYGSRGSTSDTRDDWPVSDLPPELQIDVVLAGHAHHYERMEKDGVLYIINGIGGRNPRDVDDLGTSDVTLRDNVISRVRYNDLNGAQLVTVESQGQQRSMRLDFFNINNELVDTVTLQKNCASGTSQIIPPSTTSLSSVAPFNPTSYNPAYTPSSTNTPTSSTSTETTPTPRTIPGCDSTVQCRGIDTAWKELARKATLPNAESVWDTENNQWGNFQDIYYEEIVRSTNVNPNSISASVTPAPIQASYGGPSAYDSLIREATSSEDEAALIKAVMEHESDFGPNIISSTGCSGLMQVCGGSSNPDQIQIQCKQSRDIGPRQCFVGTCRTGRVNSRVNWCDTCDTSQQGCEQDHRFDPRRNIFSGVSTFRGKVNQVSNCGTEHIKATISAYNIGEGIVKAAIDAAGGNCNEWSRVQQAMVDNYQPSPSGEGGSLFGFNKNWLTLAKLNNQRDTSDAYVGKIYRSYLGYLERGLS